MIWKRLNDHGKNWRHVYKALVLLEYLIKTGSEKVARAQCYSSYILSSGGAAVQGEYICHPDPEGLPGAVLDLCHPSLFVLTSYCPHPLVAHLSLCPHPFSDYLLSSSPCCSPLPLSSFPCCSPHIVLIPLFLTFHAFIPLLLTSHCPRYLIAHLSLSSSHCCLSLLVPLHLLLTYHCPNPLVAYPSLSSYSCCQFVEENKDQGLNVREKAKAMVSLLKVTKR